jgi:hypothetical protein
VVFVQYTLSKIHMRGNDLKNEEAIRLCDALSQRPVELVQLDISKNKISGGAKVCQALASLALKSRKLTSLNISGMHPVYYLLP